MICVAKYLYSPALMNVQSKNGLQRIKITLNRSKQETKEESVVGTRLAMSARKVN